MGLAAQGGGRAGHCAPGGKCRGRVAAEDGCQKIAADAAGEEERHALGGAKGERSLWRQPCEAKEARAKKVKRVGVEEERADETVGFATRQDGGSDTSADRCERRQNVLQDVAEDHQQHEYRESVTPDQRFEESNASLLVFSLESLRYP